MKYFGRSGIYAGLIILALLSSILLNAGLVYFGKHFYPVERGTPAEFWDALYRLNLSKNQFSLGTYPPQGDRCIYYVQGFHGEFLHEASREEVRQLLPVVRELAPRIMGERLTPEEKALLESGGSIDQLVWARLHAEEASRRKDAPEIAGYGYRSLTSFLLRWERIERYWANLVFEGLYLNGLLLLFWIPFLGPCRHMVRGVTTGISVPLLFLPYYLGYCPWTFTSAGPSGGALYPMIMIVFYGFPIRWNGFDQWLIEALPKPLDWISQSTGGMLSVSGGGAPSPTVTLVTGILLGVAVCWLSRYCANLNTKQAAFSDTTQ